MKMSHLKTISSQSQRERTVSLAAEATLLTLILAGIPRLSAYSRYMYCYNLKSVVNIDLGVCPQVR